MSTWQGDAEMRGALEALTGFKRPINANKIKTAAKTALKYSLEYKMAVHAIESFIRKTDDKLPGLYVLDAICRQPKCQMFKDRFTLRLKETVLIVADNVSSDDRASFVRLMEEWDRRSLFDIGESFFALANSRSGGGGGATSIPPTVGSSSSSSRSGHHHSSSSSSSSSSEGRDPRKRKLESSESVAVVSNDDTTSNTIGQPENNLEDTSTLLSKSSTAAPGTMNFFIHDIPTGSRGRLCPFADSCIFGEKCRFSHSDVIGFQPTYQCIPKKHTLATL